MTKQKSEYTKKREQNKLERSLVEQLAAQKKNTIYHLDLVKDYMKLYVLKEAIQEDLEKNGLRYEAMNGHGQLVSKSNESVMNIVKVNSQMLKILSDLNIQGAVIIEEVDDSDGYM